MSLALLLGTVSEASSAASGDLSGTWKAVAPRVSILPDDDAIPFTEAGRARFLVNRRARAKRDFEFDRTTSRCAAPGTPRVMLTSKRFRIFEDADVITIGFEQNRYRRVIAMPALAQQNYIMNADEQAKLVGTKMGTSKGHWEGSTLVVSTIQLADSTLLDDVVPHSFDLVVTERFALKNADLLEDRITIADPENFTRPWETTLTYARQPDAVFPEDICLDRLTGKPSLPTTR